MFNRAFHHGFKNANRSSFRNFAKMQTHMNFSQATMNNSVIAMAQI